jgi:hypothetical protein
MSLFAANLNEPARIYPVRAVIDAQSTKTTEKGSLAAMMPARRSRAESDTSS